ncbi:MAG TPA: hypothetical protein ENN77_02100, partial [Candidatus Wirthbacteria bacterium]|nr:hypothetical protein [Candidatus Wirthbacteria bacterium]
MKVKNKQNGYVIILVLGVVSVLFILVTGLASLVINESYSSHRSQDNLVSLQIAEAGINYYTWFLNHFPGDFQNGYGVEGPYSHDYYDGNGNKLGFYSLDITPPAAGSTICTIRSTGYTERGLAKSRVVEAQVGLPSLAKFAFLTHSDIWFGTGETVDGMLHSNGGIRFDGIATNLITSARPTYICQPFHGCNPAATRNGIWGSGGPESFWEYPVAAIDFAAVSGSLSSLRDAAMVPGGGHYLEPTRANEYGYQIILKSNSTATPNDDSYDLYKVTNTWQTSGWTPDGGNRNYRDKIRNRSWVGNYAMPASGIIFVEDNVWVSGQTSSRTTIAAAVFPEAPNKYVSIV